MKSLSRTITVIVILTMAIMTLAWPGEDRKRSELIGKLNALAADAQQSADNRVATLFETLEHNPYAHNIRVVSRFRNADTVLVVPTAETASQSPEVLSAVTKDMNIMCRVLDKELGLPASVPTDISYYYFRTPRTTAPELYSASGAGRYAQGTYLEGYGALFVLEVDFPLVPSPEPEQTEEDEDDSVWRQTELEIYHPDELRKDKDDSPAKEYDPQKIDDLQTKLVKALKYAARIRGLKPDEWVIVTVKSRQPAAVPGKVLTIRAKKSEIDSFHKRNIDLDQFRQRVQMFTY